MEHSRRTGGGGGIVGVRVCKGGRRWDDGGLTVDDWFLLLVETPTFGLSAGGEDAEAACSTSVHNNNNNNRRRTMRGVCAGSSLPLAPVCSATSSTTRSPSRLDMGRPRSSGSSSPLCARQTDKRDRTTCWINWKYKATAALTDCLPSTSCHSIE